MSVIYKEKNFTGERSLFRAHDAEISKCIFADGESPLKESSNLVINDTDFNWKYPMWYSNNIRVSGGRIADTARAGIWYTNNIYLSGTVINAPKSIWRCSGVFLNDIVFSDASETLWQCRKVSLRNVRACGDYFAMNSSDMSIEDFSLKGDYCFDGARSVTVRNARLISKDAFWNSENVTVYDSYISGEYLGWNAKNLTLINCTVESLQGMCYIDNLVMKNCKTLNTTLAFEYSTVDADICGGIESVLNPSGGVIRADFINNLIMEKDKIDPAKTSIILHRKGSD